MQIGFHNRRGHGLCQHTVVSGLEVQVPQIEEMKNVCIERGRNALTGRPSPAITVYYLRPGLVRHIPARVTGDYSGAPAHKLIFTYAGNG